MLFMQKARSVDLKIEVTTYPLERANEALDDLRHGRFSGAAVLVP
jgi:propanol-preferring alcohol dehydrogenase